MVGIDSRYRNVLEGYEEVASGLQGLQGQSSIGSPVTPLASYVRHISPSSHG